MTTFKAVKQVVLESGLWSSGRYKTHSFILSPDTYGISPSQNAQLQELGKHLHECLQGLCEILNIASNPKRGNNRTWQKISRVLRTGIPKIYRPIQSLNPADLPRICKVDLMETTDGRFVIAEIDAHNKHGLGYSVLAARMRKAVAPNAPCLPGVALLIARQAQKLAGNNELVLLYGNQERFYLPEFMILKNELAKHNIKLMVVNEIDIVIKNGNLAIPGCSHQPQLLVDFPFLYRNRPLNQILAQKYSQNELRFLIPPKPFLGSKAILALLRNDANNAELEHILQTHISYEALECVRAFLPETHMASDAKRFLASSAGQSKRFVIKETISSGMKGTVFPDDPQYSIALKTAFTSDSQFVLQAEVENQWQTFRFFANDGALMEDLWHVRLTAHYVEQELADIIVTARRDKRVHGARDCLQLGVVLNPYK